MSFFSRFFGGRGATVPRQTAVEPDILYFKSNQAALEVACEVMDCTVETGKFLPAIVRDHAPRYLTIASGKTKRASIPVRLNVAAAGGAKFGMGLVSPEYDGPEIKAGDLVALLVEGVIDAKPGEDETIVGLIVHKLEPEFSTKRMSWRVTRG